MKPEYDTPAMKFIRLAVALMAALMAGAVMYWLLFEGPWV